MTLENEVLPFHQEELAVGTDGKDERLMFIWPTTIVHRIDKCSPLYNLSAQDLLKERFEIVVMLGEFPETNWCCACYNLIFLMIHCRGCRRVDRHDDAGSEQLLAHRNLLGASL